MRNDAETLSICLLGELRIARGVRVLELPASKKSRALLAYLVAANRPHSRERLCELLWEGPGDPRAALRWSLTKIRPLLDEPTCPRLVTEKDRVGFEPKGAVVDLATVRADLDGSPETAATDTLRLSATRFRGEFLEGLDLPGAYRYHEWLVGEREAARALRITVLTELARRLGDEDPEMALRYARERVSFDPLTEVAHVAIIRLLVRLGRAREARAQYETCKRILEHELGARPSPELELSRSSLASRAPRDTPAPSAAIAVPAPVVHAMTLVGRARETAVLETAVRAATVGAAGGIILVTGDPGIGKSRLLEELARLMRAAGGRVLSSRAFEAEGMRAYGPWIDALRSEPVTEILARVAPDLSLLLPELGDKAEIAADRNRLFDAVARALRGLAASSALLVLIDDIHWLDEASAALLHFVARVTKRSRILVAFGARPGELADNPAALRLVRSLGREQGLLEISVPTLDSAATAELVESVSGRAAVGRVFEESEGNPLFALEIARAIAAGADTFGSVESLIAERLERLDGRAASLLSWAATLGRSFRLDVLEKVTLLPPMDLVDSLEELERRGVVRAAASVDGGTGYDFSHDLFRKVAYGRVSEPRRRLIHLQIARALFALPDPTGALAGDVAHHAGLGNDPELCARSCVIAGERCLRLFANAEAAAFCARGHLQADLLEPDQRIPLHMAFYRIEVRSTLFRNRAQELESGFARTILQAQEAGLQAEVLTGLHSLSELHWGEGDDARAHEASLRALEVNRSADSESAIAIGQTGRCLAQLERDMGRARSLLEEADSIATKLGMEVPGVSLGLGVVRWFSGDVQGGVELIERGLVQALRARDHWIECECLTRLAQIALFRGEPEQALARTAELLPIASKMGGGSEESVALALQALAERALGRTGARAAVERAISTLRDIDARGHLAYALTADATMDLADGDVVSARRKGEEAVLAAETIDRKSTLARARVVLARAAVAEGDLRTAGQYAEATRVDYLGPGILAADVRDDILKLANHLGISFPTPAQTDPTSPDGQDPVARLRTLDRAR